MMLLPFILLGFHFHPASTGIDRRVQKEIHSPNGLSMVLEGGVRWSVQTPEFEPTPLSVHIAPGQSAQLPCRVRNLADKVVSWIRRSDLHILTSGTYLFTGDSRIRIIHPEGDSAAWTLQLNDAKPEDDGLYECQVNTDPKMKQTVLLTVSDMPQVMELTMKDDSWAYGSAGALVLGPKEKYVKEGSAISLTCHVKIRVGKHSERQRPPRLVEWLHQDQPIILNAGSRSGVSVDTEKEGSEVSSRLTLTSVRMSDSGKYTCQPYNADPDSVSIIVFQGERTEAMMGDMAPQPPIASSSSSAPYLCVFCACWLAFMVR